MCQITIQTGFIAGSKKDFICKKPDKCASGEPDRIVAQGGGLYGVLDEKSGKYAGKIRLP